MSVRNVQGVLATQAATIQQDGLDRKDALIDVRVVGVRRPSTRGGIGLAPLSALYAVEDPSRICRPRTLHAAEIPGQGPEDPATVGLAPPRYEHAKARGARVSGKTLLEEKEQAALIWYP